MSEAIEIAVTSHAWRSFRDAKRIVERAIEACRATLGRDCEMAETCVVLCDDAEIRELNRRWRGFDKATNVLSFPAGSSGPGAPLGDIAISYETVAREALADNKTMSAHLSHLAVHGYLHLVGFDHESDAEAEEMESLERRVLNGLGISDPYAPRAAAPKRRRIR